MRFREALILFIGISIMVFGLSYFVYRYFFKRFKRQKNEYFYVNCSCSWYDYVFTTDNNIY